MTMNTEIKVKWIEALRSGVYNQTQSVLEGNGGFCCLGVLMACQGHAPQAYFENEAVIEEQDEADRDDLVEDALRSSTVPYQFNAGLTQPEMDELAARNDGGLYNDVRFGAQSFAQIADYIEANL
jgi:hypothetical protein